VAACGVLLDRGFGKPLSAAEVAQQRLAQARPASRPFIINLIRDGKVVESRQYGGESAGDRDDDDVH
jgi:hypothetical protein